MVVAATSTAHGYRVASQRGASPRPSELAFAGGAHVYRWGMRHMGFSRAVGSAAGGALCGPVLSIICRPLGARAAQDFLDPHSVGPTYYGGHIFNGFGRMVEGDIVGGGGEVVKYGAEGALEAGEWLVDQLF